MNYYEELGLTPEATPEDIHQAHRKLTKLLHPDQQTDETLRRLAEAQMRRLNSIVDVLCDSESRRHYDKGINAALERLHYTPSATNLGMHPSMEREDPGQLFTRMRRKVPWWVWSTVGALTLTSAAVWFFAYDLGSSFGSKTMAYVPVKDPPAQSGSGASIGPPPLVGTRESRAEARLQDLTARLRSVFETKPSKPKAPESAGSHGNPQPPQNEVAATVPQQTAQEQVAPPATEVPTAPKAASHNDPAHDVETAMVRQAPPKIDSIPASTIPPPAVQTPSLPKSAPPQQPVPAPAVISQHGSSVVSTAASNPPAAPTVVPGAISELEGEWIYAPAKPEKRKPGLYPPDFIELKLFHSQGELRGIYHARYQVDEARDISPDVSFQLSSQEANAKTLNWESANGSRGWLKVNPVDKSTIKVQWQTTVYSKQPGLTAGVATLVRH